jgi:pimeloyl-ACP methyl ester carboxylesterase
VDAAPNDDIVVVGHSGAGVFLPSIGEGLGERLRALVFVDAQIPPHSGVQRTPPELVELLDAQTTDGILARWCEWWPDAAMREMVPDAELRSALRAEMPQLPRAFYDMEVPLPDGWSEGPCGYVRLSQGYRELSNEAIQRGWPHAEIDGHHLTLVTEPEKMLDAVDLVAGLLPRASGLDVRVRLVRRTTNLPAPSSPSISSRAPTPEVATLGSRIRSVHGQHRHTLGGPSDAH